MRKMFDWIKDTKEARIALAICAGLLLYRFVTAALSSTHEWYERASNDTHESIIGSALLLLLIGLSVWVWRSRRRRMLGAVGALAVALIAAYIWNDIRRERDAAKPVTLDFSTYRPLPPHPETAKQEQAKERELTKDEKDQIRKSCKQRSVLVKTVPIQQNYNACVFWLEVAARQK